MPSIEPARTRVRRTRLSILTAVVLAGTALVAFRAHEPWTTSSAATSPITMAPLVHRAHDILHRGGHGSLGTADGVVPDGTTVFDDVPAVAKLDPELLGALRRAAADAADDGIELRVNSGWRSAAYQERLLRQAISEYGSEEEAARWVVAPEKSAHVSGDAVDIGPEEAARWLSDNGAAYGLCQIYDDEPWHYELRPAAVRDGCPRRYADPTHDPRMR